MVTATDANMWLADRLTEICVRSSAEKEEPISPLVGEMKNGLLSAGGQAYTTTLSLVNSCVTATETCNLAMQVREGLLNAGAACLPKIDNKNEDMSEKYEDWLVTGENENDDNESIVTLDMDSDNSIILGLEQFEIVDHQSWLA